MLVLVQWCMSSQQFFPNHISTGWLRTAVLKARWNWLLGNVRYNDASTRSVIYLAVFIGGVAFTGSIVAFTKLNSMIPLKAESDAPPRKIISILAWWAYLHWAWQTFWMLCWSVLLGLRNWVRSICSYQAFTIAGVLIQTKYAKIIRGVVLTSTTLAHPPKQPIRAVFDISLEVRMGKWLCRWDGVPLFLEQFRSP